ncbi:DUF2207 domain-containing protein [Pseudohongiella sp.]|uniref:DUF2207 domain-containing protein n=1 Tax=marine sediment metagenome TaxID=412755 RepID=A0A0F9W449_9ZZZZ|nr:DUF2207 domain-containing protein [Pseudohongiella sp.]HDZ07822.1 DUF2207 domain-containing protein [Pseudohongiella sp.]HEA62861.1 DUF2207 domain-containing protein [Pseudohongiella sp.]
MKQLALIMNLLVLALLLSSPLAAQERILSYHSDIDIAADASMEVTETIRVRAEGNNIRRGIYRDFPTRYRDRLGNRYRVEFDVLEVTRNGEPELWQATERGNGVRVDFGGDDFLPVPAEYEYTIRYRTNRQIGFFDSHDELYWNVTGNGWDFAIEQASATVTLPQPVSASELDMEAYTGAAGEQGQAYEVRIRAGSAGVQSTAPLPPGQGLTLVLSWPKGVVAEPDGWQRVQYLLVDNRGLLLALVTLIASMCWLMSSWVRVGRDPAPGVIFPRYQPPAGYSPASMRYIRRMSYDNTALTAAIVNLAVKGYLRIKQSGKDYSLQKAASSMPLAAGEQALLNRLFADGDMLALEQDNHNKISAAIRAHKKSLAADYRHKYFVSNAQYLWPPVLGIVIMFAVVLIIGGITPLSVIAFVVNIPLLLLFFWLLHAPTAAGRKLLDQVDGFRLYLEVAEKADMKLRHPPELTPALFERYMPYAIALDVDEAWAEKFTQVFADLERERGTPYHPAWYVGAFNGSRMGDFSQSVSSSLSSAISSASQPPGSASGAGGGGFSGGGGGGGGGGGR